MNTAMVKCNICNREVDEHSMTYFPEVDLLLCANCGPQLYTCAGCANRERCGIQSNEQNIPPTIVRTIQQEGRIMQIQVPNPELIKIYCTNCQCALGSTYCGRQTTGMCDNWKLHNDYKRKEGEG